MIPSVACLIPARAGSVRVPSKNIQVVGGRTLLERAIHTCLAAYGDVYVSTDDAKYGALATTAGARVPSLRPVQLAAASTGMDAVVQHALEQWIPIEVDVLLLVQPTSPFTTPDDLRDVVRALTTRPDAATALTAVAVDRCLGFALVQNAEGLSTSLAPALAGLRSQELPKLHRPTGGAFAANARRLRQGGPLVMDPIVVVEVPEERGLDIDDPADLATARARLP